MGTAAAGLFSAARSSIRRVENVTNKISKAPDVTKEQKFGINYVGFFGSKKNVKILKLTDDLKYCREEDLINLKKLTPNGETNWNYQ